MIPVCDLSLQVLSSAPFRLPTLRPVPLELHHRSTIPRFFYCDQETDEHEHDQQSDRELAQIVENLIHCRQKREALRRLRRGRHGSRPRASASVHRR